MTTALQITGLTKRYGDFLLDHVSFGVPTGSIVGLIGENGAGKSTTIRGVLGMIHKEAGRIALLGQDTETMDPSLKEKVGVVLGDCNFSEELTPLRLSKVLRDVYSGWDQAYFETLLTQLHVPQNKKIKGLSRGTKMKLSIAAAMAHHPQLLILDEATSGLDPVVRDDILDLFLDFVQDERNSILVSSHITSDLEKVADYIVFLHEGRVVFCEAKDVLLECCGILKCGAEQFAKIEREDILACRKRDYEYQVLVRDGEQAIKKYPKALLVPTTLDEIMLLYVKRGGNGMKGLIRNNIYSMQSNLLVSFLIALVLGVLPLFIQGDGILQMVISMQIYVFVANVGSSLHADELSGWDRFEITLPVCRSQIVQAKYLTFILLFALGIGAGTLTLGGLWLTGRAPAFRDVLHGYAFGLTLSALSTAVFYPLMLKFGTDKSDVFLILSGILSCVMLVLISGILSLFTGSMMNMKAPLVDVVSVGTALVMFAASYCISEQILQNKEFV